MSTEERPYEAYGVSIPVTAEPVSRAASPVVAVQPKRKKGYVRWVVLALIAGLIAVIGSTVRGSAFVYSKYVDELMAPGESAKWVGRVLRVEGLVRPGSIAHQPGTRNFRFKVYRNGAELPVTYSGVVPDTFRDCAGVTVRGVLGSNGVFASDEVIAKCPSKYEAATVVNGECIVGVAPDRTRPR